jgi:hypothetical protein
MRIFTLVLPLAAAYSGLTCRNNRVFQRRDAFGFDHLFNISRPWSVHPASVPAGYQACDSPETLLDSLALGVRANFENEAFHEAGRSSFHPHGCASEWYTSRGACNTAKKLSSIIIIGDSLSRHISQAFFVVFRDNYYHGGVPLHSTTNTYDWCQCDGQFSEAVVCRFDGMHGYSAQNTPFAAEDNRALGFCDGETHFSFSYVPAGNVADVARALLWGDSTRPALVYLAGGLHFRVDARAALEHFFYPTHEAIRAANRPVIVAWGGLGAQFRQADAAWPHQSRERTREFNAVIQAAAAERGAYFLDWWNLTLGAQTSDGEHHLTDVNVFKVNYLLRLADLNVR